MASKNGTEACDDGNTANETTCDYGTQSCQSCNATCTAVLNLVGPYCGDGTKNGSEACDDGNTTTETDCPYGQASCTLCDATARRRSRSPARCAATGCRTAPRPATTGTRSRAAPAASGCTATQLSKATGTIKATSSNNIQDGKVFSISDGVNSPVIFEFDKNGSVSSGRVPVAISSSTDVEVAAAIQAAISNPIPSGSSTALPLDISAVVLASATDTVQLTNNQVGRVRQPDDHRERDRHTGCVVSGMSGGAGYDCAAGTKCTQNADCDPSLVCNATTNTCSIP